MYEKGITGMRYSISNTAEYGDLTRGKRIIGAETRQAMKDILGEIQSGEFAREWIAENRAGQENFQRMRKEEADHQVEREGKELRSHDGLDRDRLLGAAGQAPAPKETTRRSGAAAPSTHASSVTQRGPSTTKPPWYWVYGRRAAAEAHGGGAVGDPVAPWPACRNARWSKRKPTCARSCARRRPA